MLPQIVKPSDSDLLKLLKDFNKNSLSEFKHDLKAKKEEILVLKLDGELAGVIKFKNLNNHSRIESFYVIKEELRHKGLGQRLYDAYEKSLKSKKFIEAYVYLTNIKAQRFYEKNGFVIVKKSKDNAGEEMYYMKKSLN